MAVHRPRRCRNLLPRGGGRIPKSTGPLTLDISHWQPNFTATQFEQFKAAGVGRVIVKLGGANGSLYANWRDTRNPNSTKWADHVRTARTTGHLVDHYWFNGRAASPAAQAQAIVDTYDGLSINDDETLWWDIEDESYIDKATGQRVVTTAQWSPGEVIEHARALNDAGIPFHRQGVYMSSSVTRNRDWSAVRDLGLRIWVADYGRNDGTISSKPLVGFWEEVEFFQFTSANIEALKGVYASDSLDVNISGEDVWTVARLQRALNQILGINLVVDGDFGPKSIEATKAYQALRKLAVDGFPGWNTLTQMELDLAA